MPLDGSWAEVQRSGDLRAGEPFRSEPGDVGFLCCQLSTRLYRTFAYRLSACCELVSRAIRERLNSHRGQRLVGRSQLSPGIGMRLGHDPDPDWPATIIALLDAGASTDGIALSPDDPKPPSPEVAALLRARGVPEEAGGTTGG
jgi:hypothetical protein